MKVSPVSKMFAVCVWTFLVGTAAFAADYLHLSADELATKLLAAKKKDKVGITLGAGKFILDKPLVLDSRFDGLKITAHKKGSWLVGVTPIPVWESVAGKLEAARLDPAVRDKVLRAPLPEGSGDGELFLEGVPQKLAVYPATGWLEIQGTDLVDPNGRINFVDPAPATWNPLGWTGANRLNVEGWSHQYEWFCQPLAELTATLATIRNANYYTFLGGHRFRFSNVLEALTQPGTYVVDDEAGFVYWLPPQGWTGQTAFSTLSGLIELNGVSNFQFVKVGMGLCRGDAVTLKSTADVVFQQCVFEGTVGRGVVCADDATVRLTINGCDFRDLGGDGVVLRGGDRFALIPSGSVIKDTLFERCGRTNRVSSAVRLSGVGHRLERCLFYDLYAGAIRLYNSGSPKLPAEFGLNDTTIKDCFFQRICLEATDAGAILGSRDWTSQGNIIDGCVFRDIQPGWDSPLANNVSGVMLDDFLAGWTLVDCSFVNCQVGIHNVGGWGTTINHCQFLECVRPIRFYEGQLLTAWEPGNALYDRVVWFNVTMDPWASRYPLLADVVGNRVGTPSFGYATDCAITNCAYNAGAWLEPIRVATADFELAVLMLNNTTTTWEVPTIERLLAP